MDGLAWRLCRWPDPHFLPAKNTSKGKFVTILLIIQILLQAIFSFTVLAALGLWLTKSCWIMVVPYNVTTDYWHTLTLQSNRWVCSYRLLSVLYADPFLCSSATWSSNLASKVLRELRQWCEGEKIHLIITDLHSVSLVYTDVIWSSLRTNVTHHYPVSTIRTICCHSAHARTTFFYLTSVDVFVSTSLWTESNARWDFCPCAWKKLTGGSEMFHNKSS